MQASDLKLKVTTASWFLPFVESQRKAALEAVEKGAPVEFVQDQFESAVRSAAFDAIKVSGLNEPS